jgi:hypothetical protein
LLSPHVHVDIEGRGVLFRWRVILRQGNGLLGAGKDADAGEMAWLVAGMSGRTGDAVLSTLGLALELEARSDARGALRKKRAS